MFKLKSSPLLLALTFCAVAFLPSCGDDDDGKAPQVTAGFTFKKDAETKGKVAFTNTSTNAKTYAWDFGDENKSDEENPTHTYAKDGTYTVTLTATNGEQSAKETKTVNLVTLITLKGDTSVSIKIGAEYKDAGATAVDALDQDISDKIVVMGVDAVNTLQPGKYVIMYDVEDAAGNKAAQVTRTVTVTYDAGLLTNGDFQDGANGWTLRDDLKMKIKTEEGNSYLYADNKANVNASQDSSVTYAAQQFEDTGWYGNTYTLSFNASANAAKTIGVGFQEKLFGIGAITERAHQRMFKTFDLSPETQRFTYEMTILSEYFITPGSLGSIFFVLGGASGSVKIGYVAFELVEKAKFVTELPADFEDGATFGTVSSSFMVLSNVANPDPSGNPSANVLKVTRGSGTTKGTSNFANTFATDFKPATGAIFKLKIWSPVNDARVEFKLIGSNPNNVVSLAQNVAKAKAWEELTFDFSKTINAAGKLFNLADGYNGIRINPNTNGDAATAETFYFDDLRQVGK